MEKRNGLKDYMQAAVLLISKLATCDPIVAAFSKLKAYIVDFVQGAESPTIVSILLMPHASSGSQNKVPRF